MQLSQRQKCVGSQNQHCAAPADNFHKVVHRTPIRDTRRDNLKVKDGGQECPPYTGLLSYPLLSYSWIYCRVQ
jgi:hypothetical protein